MVHRTTIFALPIILLCAATARAVQFGSQALPDGGVEYIVQIEPDLVDVLRQQPISSDIPPELHNVRRIRLMVGEGRLPQQNEISLPPPPDVPGRPAENTSGDTAVTTNPDPKSLTNTNPKTEATTAPPEPDRGAMAGLLQFFHPGPARHIDPNDANSNKTSPGAASPINSTESQSGGAIPAAGINDHASALNAGTSIPKIGENDLPRGPADRPADDGFRTFGAAMPPSSPDAPRNSEGPSATAPKPWFPFMGALLVLFASLGANVYLVWIHQTVRAKYRALVQRLPREAAAA